MISDETFGALVLWFVFAPIIAGIIGGPQIGLAAFLISAILLLHVAFVG